MSEPACTASTCPYRILAVSCHATEGQIKKAHRDLAKQYHPDVNQSADATQRTQSINLARDMLLKADSRAGHNRDCATRSGCPSCQPRGAPAGARRRAAEPGPASPPPSPPKPDLQREPLAFDDVAFVPGHVYCVTSRSRFRVLSLSGDNVTIQRADGGQDTYPVRTLWDIWQKYAAAHAPPRPSSASASAAGGGSAKSTHRRDGTQSASDPHAPPPPPPGPPPTGTPAGAFGRPLATDDAPLAWNDRTFTAGRTYANAYGVYEVVSLGNGTVDIRYTDLHTERWPRARLRDEWLALRNARTARRRAAAQHATRAAGPDPQRGTSRGAPPPPRARAARVHPLRSTVLELEAKGLLRTHDDPTLPGVYYIEPLPEHEAAVAQALRSWMSRGLVRRAPARERVTGRRAWYAG